MEILMDEKKKRLSATNVPNLPKSAPIENGDFDVTPKRENDESPKMMSKIEVESIEEIISKIKRDCNVPEPEEKENIHFDVVSKFSYEKFLLFPNIPYEFHTGFPSEFNMNYIQISYEFQTNFIRISYEFHTNFIIISYEFDMNYIRISYEFHNNFIRV